MINFNNTSGVFEYTDASGAVVASSANLSYLKQKVRNLGLPLDGTAPAAANTQVTSLRPSVVVPNEFSVDERFDFIERFTKGVARGSYLSLVVSGAGGIGKSYVVTNTLASFGLTEIRPMDIKAAAIDEDSDEEIQEKLINGMPLTTAGDYIVIKGFSTAKYLYRTLYDNNGKIIVLDDCDSIFKDMNASNILKAALDSSVPRYIAWGAESRGDDDLPSRFEFTGRVIFISNLSADKIPQPIISRSVKVDLTLTRDEKIERIEKVFTAINEPEASKSVVMAFIREYAERFTDLNVRSALTILQIYKAEPDEAVFKKMALYNAIA